MKPKIPITIGILAFVLDLYSQASPQSQVPIVGLNSELTYQMMEPNQNLRKGELLIDAKSEGNIPERGLQFGFAMIGLADIQFSNRDSKFAYLMRHPTSNNQIGETVSEAVLHSAQLSLVGSVNSWLTAYGELLYNPEQSFGSGTITSLARNQVQLRKGILMVGNLNKLPLYLALGKMDIPFGQTRSVSPFTNSTMWHTFGGLAYGAIVGYKKGGLSASFSAIQGGAQFRAINMPIAGTSVPSRLNNYAMDANYTLRLAEGIQLRAGLSYLRSSGYCQPWPIVHFMPCEDSNPALAYYGELNIKERFLLQGSFAQTSQVWPGTFNANAPLNDFPASRVSSLDIGASYQLNKIGNILYRISGEFSNFRPGADGSPWERQSQIILGFNAQVAKTNRIFLEAFRTFGYSPLNFISGGNFEDPGITHSDRDARSTGVVAGILFSI